MTNTETNLSDIIELARVFENEQTITVRSQRKSPRFAADGLIARCEILTKGQPQSQPTYLAGVVDISKRGLQIIWPGFLHEGTKLRITIQIPDTGEIVQFDALTKWCRFLRGRHHNVGAMAATRIPVRKLVSQESWHEACLKHPELLDPLEGRVAVFTNNGLILQSVVFQIQDTQLEMRHVETSGSLYDLLDRGNADLVIIDADSDGAEASEIMQTARAKCFNGPIVIMALGTKHKRAIKKDELGRSRFVRLPMKPNSIVQAIRDIIRDHPKCMRDTRPLYSKTPDVRNRDKLLTDFIAMAKDSCEKGRYALDMDDIVATLKVVHSLAATGASLGYPALSEASQEFIAATQDPTQKHKLVSHFRAIVSVVNRLQPGHPEGIQGHDRSP